MQSESDLDLVASARAGDVAAYGRFVQRHQQRVYRLALHMLKQKADAEDVTQETFVRAWSALDRFDGRSEPFTWVYRIAVNLSLNVLRARRTRPQAPIDDDARVEALLAEYRRGPGDPLVNSENRQLVSALLRAMESLSETLRTTLVLVAVDGMSHGDAASILGCPEGTVAWRVHEARRKLRAALSEMDKVPEEEP